MLRKLIACTAALAAGVMLADYIQPTVIPAMKSPVLDGVIEAAEWSGVLSGNLVNLQTGEDARHATRYYLGCDNANLYFAFDCSEEEIAKIRHSFTHIEERDSAIYTDDCIEIFVDPFGNAENLAFHFAVNSLGIIYDAYQGDVSYQSNLKVACKINDDGWVLEGQLPFADLGISPKGAELLRMNLGRERWIDPIEFTCTGYGIEGSFGDVKRLLYYRPLPPGAAEMPFTVWSFGTPADPVLKVTEETGTAGKANSVKIYCLAEDGSVVITAKAQPIGTLSMRYNQANDKNVDSVIVSIFEEGKTDKPVYVTSASYPRLASFGQLKAMKIADPLFYELLSNEFPPQRDFHGLQWLFGIGSNGATQAFAMSKALPFSGADIAVEQNLTGMAAYTNIPTTPWVNEVLLCDKLGTPIAAMPRVLDRNVTSGLETSAIVIPEIRKLWLEDVKAIASNPLCKILTFADEVSECVEVFVINEFQKFPDNQELREFDAMIKEKYGHGKYGIPVAEESDPLAWIAYRRALNDELVKLYHEAHDLAKSINPDIIIMSDDPIGHENKLYSYADWDGAVDIVTHQLYPRGNPDIDSFGFMTRRLAHLTGAREVWPCPHVEEYGASFTPEEVLCKLSATVRNGATGFHYYLADTLGNESHKKNMIHERWGAPDRYAVEINALKLMSRLPRLAFPEYDTGFFTSTDSLRANPGIMLRRPVDQDIYLHGYLGYGAGVNYRFLNEKTLQDLGKYKYIATVESDYIELEAFEALKQYVSDGGTLLVLNTNAFRFTPDGDSLEAERREFLGFTVNGESKNPKNFTFMEQKIPVTMLNCVRLVPASDSQVMAHFANEQPAMVMHPYGQGRVITLAANPCVSRLAGNKPWKDFFLNFSEACGARTKCDIWRFELPQSLLPAPVKVNGTCLTNNFVVWEHFVPNVRNASDEEGWYALNPAPTFGDNTTGEIPFSQGKLTDRPRAVVADDSEGWGTWTIGWEKRETPVTISCRFAEDKPVTKVMLLVSGTMSDASINIGGQTFEFPCPENYNQDTFSVREFTMDLPEPVTDSRLEIVIKPSDATLLVSEMEIWSE